MTIAPETSVKYDPFADEHDCLKRTIVGLRRVLTEQRVSQDAVSSLLADLEESVRSHFVHEEVEDGFFENVVDQAPWLKGRADALLDEHRDLAAQLAQLRWRARQGKPSAAWWQNLTTRFEAFWATFSRHERRENELLQSAFYQDIGAED
jgi:hypothetical protein